MKRIISIGEAEKLAKEYAYEENEEALYELVQEILSQEKVVGSVDDFHNFAVSFSRKDDYETACNILDKGLEQFPKAVDLLADYLQNGVNCNRFKQCEECFNKLLKIPMMRWTWRGFSFSIDYMQIMADNIEDDNELIEWKNKMLEMAENYHKFYTYSEDVFLAKADIFQYFNDREKEIEILNTALEQIKNCPKCALRLADIFFEKGEYDKALEYIERCKYSSIQTQEKINQGYMYYLSGLCKVAQMHQLASYENEKLVEDIYCDFSIAEKLKMNFSSYKKVMDRQIHILESKSGILYDSVIME